MLPQVNTVPGNPRWEKLFFFFFCLCLLCTLPPWGSLPQVCAQIKSPLSKQLLNLRANSSTPCGSSATLLSINHVSAWLSQQCQTEQHPFSLPACRGICQGPFQGQLPQGLSPFQKHKSLTHFAGCSSYSAYTNLKTSCFTYSGVWNTSTTTVWNGKKITRKKRSSVLPSLPSPPWERVLANFHLFKCTYRPF